MLRKYREWEKGEFVVVFADTSWGGLDWSAAQFLSKTNIDVPLVYHSKALASEMTPVLHNQAEDIYNKTGIQPVVCIERNNGGVAEMERLATLNRNGKYRIYVEKMNVGTTDATENSVKLGYTTTSASRPTMLSMLKDAVDNKALRIYDKPTITEMFSFIVSQTSSSWKAQAEVGAHDDLIMSLAGAWQLYQSERAPVKMERHRPKPKRAKFHV